MKTSGQVAFERHMEQYGPLYRPQWLTHLKDAGREHWEEIAQAVFNHQKIVKTRLKIVKNAY